MRRHPRIETTGYWSVPKQIASLKSLTPGAKLLAGVLWTRRNGDNESFPDQEYLASRLSVSVSQIKRYIKELYLITLNGAPIVYPLQRGNKKTNKYLLNRTVEMKMSK